MDVSVVLVSWNVRELLKKCLESIFRHTIPDPSSQSRGVSFEVIVVDNDSSDGSADMVRQNFRQVKLVESDKNLGFSVANNIGIRQATGKYALLLNPDTEFIEDSLTRIIKKVEQDKSIGILGCRLLNPDRSTQSSARRFPTIASELFILSKLYRLFPFLINDYLMKGFDHTREQEVDQVMGAFLCVREEVFESIGLLDEKYFVWFEEVDFCWRAKKAGWRVIYSPVTQVIHHGGQSFSQQMTIKKQWWFFKSGLRFLRKRYF